MADIPSKSPMVTVPAGPLSFASDVKTLGIGAVLIVGTALGSYYLIKKESKNMKQEEAASNSLVFGTSENFAMRLRMALKNDQWYQWWADFPSVLKVFKEIPTRSAFRQVVAKYKELYNENLDKRSNGQN